MVEHFHSFMYSTLYNLPAVMWISSYASQVTKYYFMRDMEAILSWFLSSNNLWWEFYEIPALRSRSNGRKDPPVAYWLTFYDKRDAGWTIKAKENLNFEVECIRDGSINMFYLRTTIKCANYCYFVPLFWFIIWTSQRPICWIMSFLFNASKWFGEYIC